MEPTKGIAARIVDEWAALLEPADKPDCMILLNLSERIASALQEERRAYHAAVLAERKRCEGVARDVQDEANMYGLHRESMTARRIATRIASGEGETR